MYFIIEIQKDNNNRGATLVTTKEDKKEAESEYYRILQYAALSTLPKHGAILLDEDCNIYMSHCYSN